MNTDSTAATNDGAGRLPYLLAWGIYIAGIAAACHLYYTSPLFRLSTMTEIVGVSMCLTLIYGIKDMPGCIAGALVTMFETYKSRRHWR